MKRPDPQKFAVASVFALIAFVSAAFVYEHRDFFFEWDWAKSRGDFVESVDPKLVAAARDFQEERTGDLACVAKAVGHDDKFVYLGIGCVEKDGMFHAARVRHSDGHIVEIEQPKAGNYENGLRRIFPRPAFEKMRYGFSVREFQRLALARMAERPQPPADAMDKP
ncbi:MAG TPA: hypothetical protein VIH99_11825 [Bdellovibrionota bacterium]|jgi:hypothetical protein